jgi:hypothetical protein
MLDGLGRSHRLAPRPPQPGKPIPIRPCRGTPVNNPTASSTSPGPARRRHSARCPILTSRPPASATRAEPSTMSLSRVLIAILYPASSSHSVSLANAVHGVLGTAPF